MIDQRTHWDDCWRERSHHDCAVARIESLLMELASQSVPINMDEFRPMTPSEHVKVNNALRARIAELERENDALSMEASENLRRREKAESDFKELSISSNARVAEGLLARSAVALAAERGRREAAEALLLELVAVVRGECPSLLDEDSGGDARTSLDIDAHFARYKKEPT